MRNDPEAMIFDLDGVITFTARVHAAAWKQFFDEFLKKGRSASTNPIANSRLKVTM
jgi:beta-phosphoglucomutase-like phosphatase (HAD superfamily)